MKSVLIGILAAILAISLIPVHAQGDFELLGSRTYTDSADNFHIVGEVMNTSNRTWRFIEVAVPLLDANDRVIAAPTGYLFVEYLRPEESGAFHLLIPDSGNRFDAAVAYAVHLDYTTAEAIPEGLLQVILTNTTAAPGSYRISGEVENMGSNTATMVQVSAALYDNDNNLIDTSVGFTEDIPPGGRAPFTMVTGVRDASDIEHISFNVQSREYVMIPEFPIPALGLMAGIAAAIVLARRTSRFAS